MKLGTMPCFAQSEPGLDARHGVEVGRTGERLVARMDSTVRLSSELPWQIAMAYSALLRMQ